MKKMTERFFVLLPSKDCIEGITGWMSWIQLNWGQDQINNFLQQQSFGNNLDLHLNSKGYNKSRMNTFSTGH